MNNKSKKSRKQPMSALAASILPSRKPLCWKNRNLQIHLGREARDVSLGAILGRDGKCWLKRENEAEWWKLYLRGPDGTSPAYSNTYADYQGAIKEKRPGGHPAIRLRWTLRLTSAQPAFVEVLISESPSPGLSLWEFEAQLPKGWRVVRLDFPVLSIPAAPGELRMAAPVGYGHEYDLAPGEIHEGKYPSWSAVMQFVAFYGGGKGLYLAAHDPKANLKDFMMTAGAASHEFRLVHWPSVEAPPKGRFALSYPFAMAAFEGGFMEAAQIYRDFSLATPWGGAGTALERQTPEWLLDTDLWLRPDGSPADNLDLAIKGIEFFGRGIAMHWYRWHKIPYDTLYPEYLPALDGFKEAIAALQKEGTRVVPYINARLWDPQSSSWRKKKAARAAARREDGACYTELYGSRAPNNVMCPASRLWRKTIANLVRRLTKEFGVDGMYLDQIAASAGTPCHNQDHGHAPGGGAFWVEGYRDMLRQARKKLAPEHIIMSEENAECWMDQIDIHLVVNTPWDHRVIPLFPAVYSDRTLLLAYQYYAKDEPKNSLPFRLKNARAFLWGAQLGWIQPSRILAPDVISEAEFLRELAAVRLYARPYLNGGRFLGVCEVGGRNPRLQARASGAFGGHYEINEPSVQASAWEGPDGRRAALAVNLSDDALDVTIEAPDCAPKRGRRPRIIAKVFGPQGECEEAAGDSRRVSLRIPPRGARLIALHHAAKSK